MIIQINFNRFRQVFFFNLFDKTTDISSEAVSPFIATDTVGEIVTKERVKLLGDFEKTKSAENCKSVPKMSENYSGTKSCVSCNRQHDQLRLLALFSKVIRHPTVPLHCILYQQVLWQKTETYKV